MAKKKTKKQDNTSNPLFYVNDQIKKMDYLSQLDKASTHKEKLDIINHRYVRTKVLVMNMCRFMWEFGRLLAKNKTLSLVNKQKVDMRGTLDSRHTIITQVFDGQWLAEKLLENYKEGSIKKHIKEFLAILEVLHELSEDFYPEILFMNDNDPKNLHRSLELFYQQAYEFRHDLIITAGRISVEAQLICNATQAELKKETQEKEENPENGAENLESDLWITLLDFIEEDPCFMNSPNLAISMKNFLKGKNKSGDLTFPAHQPKYKKGDTYLYKYHELQAYWQVVKKEYPIKFFRRKTSEQ